jgi:hypothetical protein
MFIATTITLARRCKERRSYITDCIHNNFFEFFFLHKVFGVVLLRSYGNGFEDVAEMCGMDGVARGFRLAEQALLLLFLLWRRDMHLEGTAQWAGRLLLVNSTFWLLWPAHVTLGNCQSFNGNPPLYPLDSFYFFPFRFTFFLSRFIIGFPGQEPLYGSSHVLRTS